jgi:hypothetical protein
MGHQNYYEPQFVFYHDPSIKQTRPHQSSQHPHAGDYVVPLLPLLREKLLPAYGAQWQAGLVGTPPLGGAGAGAVVPADCEYAAAAAGAAALLFMGVGRFLAYMSPEVCASWAWQYHTPGVSRRSSDVD